MSCPLTTGFILDCKDAIGGVKSVRFTSLTNYTALTATVSSGEVTAFGAASTVFYKYDQLKETSVLTDDIVSTVNTGGLHYSPKLTIVLPKLKTAKRNEIKLLAQNRVVAIVETMDAAPTYWVVGAYNGLELSEGSATTGTAAADLNGYTLTFMGLETEQVMALNPSSGTVAQMLASITSSTQASMA
jgi:hypothetical protein